MTQQTQSPSGFLGRGPFFWLGLTLASMAVIVALSLSDAIENKAAIMILMIAPLFTIFGIFKAMLNANAAGDGAAGVVGPTEFMATGRAGIREKTCINSRRSLPKSWDLRLALQLRAQPASVESLVSVGCYMYERNEYPNQRSRN